MTASQDGTMDALHQLLAERARYETWLSQLEARRATAPSHVLERVRTDYTTRLDNVVTQLRGRAADLEASTASLRQQLAALAADETTRRDERAETELRAAVGEYTEDEARATFERCDGIIASLVAQRDVLGTELAKLQEVLVLIAPPAEAVASAPPVALEDMALEETLPSPTSVEAPRSVLEAAPAPASLTPPSAAAELEFLRVNIGSAPAPTTPEPMVEADRGDMVAPPVLAAPRRQPTPLSSSPIRDPLRVAVGESANAASGMGFLKDMPAEQVKTLKCQECSTMNYATEWYCERCGGELAAM